MKPADSTWSLRVIKINIRECSRPHPGFDYLMFPAVPLKTNDKGERIKRNEAGKFALPTWHKCITSVLTATWWIKKLFIF